MVKFEYPWCLQRSSQGMILKFDPTSLQQLGHLIFLDLPDQGAILKEGMPCIGIEATNWLGTSKVPVSGTVLAVNSQIAGLKSCHLKADDWILLLRISSMK